MCAMAPDTTLTSRRWSMRENGMKECDLDMEFSIIVVEK